MILCIVLYFGFCKLSAHYSDLRVSTSSYSVATVAALIYSGKLIFGSNHFTTGEPVTESHRRLQLKNIALLRNTDISGGGQPNQH